MVSQGNFMTILPPELVVEVAEYLDTRSFVRFRQTCKTVNSFLLRTFDRRFFNTRYCMIEHESLETLVRIACHPRLARVVESVHIYTQIFEEAVHPQQASHLEFWMRRLRNGYLPRQTLLATGKAQTMLAEVFSKLPSLHSVFLRDSITEHHFQEVPCSLGAWRGSDSSVPELSYPNSYPQDLQQWVLLPTIFSALAQTQTRPKIVEISLRVTERFLGYACILPSQFRILDMLTSVRKLTLSLKDEHEYLARLAMDEWSEDMDTMIQVPLRSFIRHSTSIELLRLDFWFLHPMGTLFLSWLGEFANYPGNELPSHIHIPSPNLPLLSTLELRRVKLGLEELLAVSTRFNLTNLTLHEVGIMHLSPSNVRENCWRIFMIRLAESFGLKKQLGSITFRHVAQITENQQTELVIWEHIFWRSYPEGCSRDRKRRAGCQGCVRYDSRTTSDSASAWLIRAAELTFMSF